MPSVNVKTDYGAVGQSFTTTGNTTAGSNVLTITGPMPPVVAANQTTSGIGSGIGISGAGPTDALSQPYFPSPSLRTTVDSINNNVIVMHDVAAATVVGAVVTIDDSIPIQNALDSLKLTGGTVTIPAGTYVLGTPHAKDNAPLFVPSSVTISGEGRDVTTLKICDFAAQISAGITSADLSAAPDAGYTYPTACAIVNLANEWWHQNQPWNPNPSQDAYIAPDHDIVIQDLTIDGNNYNQPYNFAPGNRTTTTGNLIADVRATPTCTSVNNLNPPANALLAGHTYQFVVTWGDAAGNENAGLRVNYQLAAGDNQIDLTMPTPPSNATSQFVYVRDQAVDGVDRTSWNYPQRIPDSYLISQQAQNWQRIALNTVIPAGGKYSVTGHDPTPVAPPLYPPGSGGFGFCSATTSYGMFFDNCYNLTCQRLKIVNPVLDGFGLGTIDWVSGVPPHPVTDAQFIDVQVSGCSRTGASITGAAERITYEQLVVVGAGLWGVDIEPVSGQPMPIHDVTFHRCRFAHNWRPSGAGIAVIAWQYSSIANLVIDDCEFDDNYVHVSLNQQNISGAITNCRFTNGLWAGVSSNCAANMVLAGNYFEANGRWPTGAIPVDQNTGESGNGQLLLNACFGAVNAYWTIVDNLFICDPDRRVYAMQLQNPATGVQNSAVIYGNEFRVQQKYEYVPVWYGTPSAIPIIYMPYSRNNFALSGNTGQYQILP